MATEMTLVTASRPVRSCHNLPYASTRMCKQLLLPVDYEGFVL